MQGGLLTNQKVLLDTSYVSRTITKQHLHSSSFPSSTSASASSFPMLLSVSREKGTKRYSFFVFHFSICLTAFPFSFPSSLSTLSLHFLIHSLSLSFSSPSHFPSLLRFFSFLLLLGLHADGLCQSHRGAQCHQHEERQAIQLLRAAVGLEGLAASCRGSCHSEGRSFPQGGSPCPHWVESRIR